MDDIWDRMREFYGTENRRGMWTEVLNFYRVTESLNLRKPPGTLSTHWIDWLYDKHKEAIEAELIKRRLSNV